MNEEKSILIIEDERPLLHALELKLKRAGTYKITTSSDGTDALSKISNGTYDIILMDLVLPNVNGFELLKSAKAKHPNTPVFIMSNLSQPEDIKETMSLGATKFIVKSENSLESIVEAVKEIVK